MRKIIKMLVVMLYRIMNAVLPLKKNKIVFASSLGKSYSGNPRALYEAVAAHGLDDRYECVWFYEKSKYPIPGRNVQAKYGRLRYIYHMATAAYWIFDARCPMFIKKRKGASYLQTWHGTPLKKLALDLDDVYMAGEESIEDYKDNFRKNAASWDFIISQNPFSTEVFKRAFSFKGRVLETGYPRNDVLFKKNVPEDIAAIKRSLGMPTDKKIMLYAPTWRDDEAAGIGRYRFSNALDIGMMREAFGEEAVLIIKHHYLVEGGGDTDGYGDFVRVFGQSADIQSLYLASDMLITDYSSVMFDYSLLGRPMYFYCYDMDKYKNKLRGFYFDFEETSPGPISRTTEGLISDIKGMRHMEYAARYEKFKKTYNPWDCAGSSEKVLEEFLGVPMDGADR